MSVGSSGVPEIDVCVPRYERSYLYGEAMDAQFRMLLRSADDLDPGDDLRDWDLIVGLSPCRWANCCSGDSVASDLMFGSMGNCSFVCVVVGVQS